MAAVAVVLGSVWRLSRCGLVGFQLCSKFESMSVHLSQQSLLMFLFCCIQNCCFDNLIWFQYSVGYVKLRLWLVYKFVRVSNWRRDRSGGLSSTKVDVYNVFRLPLVIDRRCLRKILTLISWKTAQLSYILLGSFILLSVGFGVSSLELDDLGVYYINS